MDKKILLVYYSRTWITRKVAEYIKQLIACDVEEIIDKKDRSWIIWYLWAGRDASLKKLTDIQETNLYPWNYDILIIGTPVRDFTMASAIRTYIQKNKENLPPKIIFYCTMWGGGDRTTFQDMTYLCSKTPIWVIWFKTKDIVKNQFQDRLKKFLEDII
jgi:flavodoxin